MDAIDIIVPVYNALTDLKCCVDSVLRHTTGEWRLILLDDASPDPGIAQYFQQLSRLDDKRIILMQNKSNLGFVGTVNRGMSETEHDVVLLNSDTIVTSGWLDKLRRCAASDPKIGTITPFSNNAEICSFPVFCADNPLGNTDPERINQAFEQTAAPVYPDIPTAVGFCMYIRRALLKRIGLFDAVTFGLGYGEENDFCMRAIEAGYRNVLCDDTFVAHTGSRSFNAKKQALAEQNMRRLLDKHPDYMRLVTEFIARDPLRPMRELAQSRLNILNCEGKRGVLHILHGRAGGTESHVRGLIAAGMERYRQYLLLVTGETWVLEDANGAVPVIYRFQHRPDELWADMLGEICSGFEIDLCHVHHIAGCRDGLLQAFASLAIPYGFTIHDFYLACPTINLLGTDGNYCGGETNPVACNACLAAQSDYADIDIVKWRRNHADFLAKASFVLAPSQWATEEFSRYFPCIQATVVPHGVNTDSPESDTMCPVLLLPNDGWARVGVMGAIGPVKGARHLEKLVARTRERGLPLRWVVIGYTDRQFQPYQDPDKRLTVHGHYHPKDVIALIDHYRIGLTVFPSAGPETYCYTLTESWSAGCPALVPPIGALGQRVRDSGAGWLMHDWRDPDAILDQIMKLVGPDAMAERNTRSEAARHIPRVTLRDMAAATQDRYDHVASQSPSLPPISRQRLIQALDTAHGMQQAATRPRRWFHRLLLRVGHAALRFRYTLLGRWLYRVLPQHWQRQLRERLLSNNY